MVTVLRTELYKGGHTGHRQWSRDHSLFRIRFVVIVAPFCKGRDSIGAHIPVLVTGNIFLQFFPILQPCVLPDQGNEHPELKRSSLLLHPRSACCTVRGTCSGRILRWPTVNAWPAHGEVWPENEQKKSATHTWKSEKTRRCKNGAQQPSKRVRLSEFAGCTAHTRRTCPSWVPGTPACIFSSSAELFSMKSGA